MAHVMSVIFGQTENSWGFDEVRTSTHTSSRRHQSPARRYYSLVFQDSLTLVTQTKTSVGYPDMLLGMYIIL